LKRSNRLVLLVGVFLAVIAFVGVLLLSQSKEPPPPEVHAALWKLRQTIDWGAIKRMVNQP